MAAIHWEPLRSLSYSSISPVYQEIGGIFEHAIRLLKITNQTDAPVTLSFDGSDSHIFLGASSYAVYDLATNRPVVVGNNDCQLAKGTQLYVASTGSPTQGMVYVECVYTDGD